MSAPISCVILAYNEAARIRIALAHARQWADDVVVVNKSSTDDTPAIVRECGARVVTIPFSPQGHEHLPDVVAAARHDWVWLFTPGEVPTPACIKAGREWVEAGVDVVRVPMRYYSFGVSGAGGPWAGGHQPRLYHRRRVEFTGYCHSPIRFERAGNIDYAADCSVLHQTHATAAGFMRSHAEYMQQEAEQGSPREVMFQAYSQIDRWQAALDADPVLLPQALAWRIYWFGVALHAWERMQPSIPETYAQRAQAALREWWGTTP